MKQRVVLTLMVTLGCVLMAWIECVLSPVYPIKSGLKVLIFLACMLVYTGVTRDYTPFQSLSRPARGSLRLPLLLAAGVFAVLLGGYALLSPRLDLSAIPGNLAAKEGFTPQTFPLAAAYITFCNSFLEELFFRGFAFLTLYRTGAKRLAWGFSALTFALYHVTIMDSWFHPVLLVLLTAGLTAAGLFFNYLDRKGSLWPTWLVHMGANLAINAIALQLWSIA